jgi:hypothetical protein
MICYEVTESLLSSSSQPLPFAAIIITTIVAIIFITLIIIIGVSSHFQIVGVLKIFVVQTSFQ